MLNTPIPEQKNLETEMYRLLSIAYENNQQFDQALLNYKLFTNSQHESATTEEPPQSDFFRQLYPAGSITTSAGAG